MSNSILDDMVKAVALLAAHDAAPSQIEVTRSTFEQLKRECLYPAFREEPNTLLGIRIVVKK